MITRFAPSPTGYLHLGHARAAYEAFNFAQRHGGTCLLRIEDIDHTRCRAEYTPAIYEDLNWLGFQWPKPVRVQSEHIAAYKNIIKQLADKGLAYPCTKSRADIKAELSARDLEVYIRDTRQDLPNADDVNIAWRLSISACRDYLGKRFDSLGYHEMNLDGECVWQVANAAQFGDVIIGRRDIGVSYHIAVTHDDAAQQITHIVRGQDLKAQTDVHVLLQKLMGWPSPIYHHHPLIMREDGQKLSKREQDPSIRYKRHSGVTPPQIWQKVL